ncbi:MAG: branched-chain amino acid ABC transporter permease [Bacillota bacterium]|nr:MAG: branched-chain amino acid ABC transporter permease [Bacillota bacterium]
MLLRRSLTTGITVLIISTIAGALGHGFGGEAGLRQITQYLVLGLFAMSVDFLWGYSGLLSFGQAVFFGLGAFCYAWVRKGTFAFIPVLENSSLAGLLSAIVLPALLAVIVGYFLFYGKITGPNFTVVTLALSFLVSLLALGWSGVFGGYTGLPHVPPLALTLGNWEMSARAGMTSFVIVTALCVIAAAGLRSILATPFGLALEGLRDSEQRLQYLGMNVAQVKMVVWTISAAVAGLAGGIYSSIAGYVAYDLLGVLLSTEAVVWVAVGGRGALVGAFLGAVLVRAVSYALSGIALSYWMLFLGVLFILVVLLGSNGIMGLVERFRRGVPSATGS